MSKCFRTGVPKLTVENVGQCGEVSTLVCAGNDNTPWNNSGWYKNGNIIDTVNFGNKYQQIIGVNNVSLRINNTNQSDNGNYTCRHAQEKSNDVTLNIHCKLIARYISNMHLVNDVVMLLG